MWWEKHHMRFCYHIYKTWVTQSAKTIWLPCCVRVQVIKQFLFSSNCTDFTVVFFMLFLIEMNSLVLLGASFCFVFSNLRKIFPTLLKTFVLFKRENISLLPLLGHSMHPFPCQNQTLLTAKLESIKIFFQKNKSLHLARKIVNSSLKWWALENLQPVYTRKENPIPVITMPTNRTQQECRPGMNEFSIYRWHGSGCWPWCSSYLTEIAYLLITKPIRPQKKTEKVWSLLMLWYLLFLQGLT